LGFGIIGVVIAILFLSSIRAGENIWTTNGPYGASVKAIAVHPQNSSVILIGTIQNGIYKTTDTGESWRHIESGSLPRNQREIVFHPIFPDTVYAATAYGVFKSNNGAEAWFDISPSGRTGQEFRAIVVIPDYPNIIITGGVGDRWKSTDGGQSWVEFSIDPEPGSLDHEIDALAIDPTNTNIVYLVTPDAEFGKGVYKSIDEGGTWFNIHNNSDSSGLGRDIKIDPTNSSILYYARHDDLRTSGGRFLSKSIDGGATWFDISPPGLSEWGVMEVCISPANHEVVYAATVNDGVYKSTDGGANWAPANDSLESYMCASLAADQITGALYLGLYMDGIYKSTDGGGSWRRISQNLLASYFGGLALTHDSPPTAFAVGTLGCFRQPREGTDWERLVTGIPIWNKPGAIEIDRDIASSIYVCSFSPFYPPPAPCGLYLSTDSGANWTFRNNGLPADQVFDDLAISYGHDGGRRIFLGAGFEALPSSGIYYSDDFGGNWDRCVAGLPTQAYRLVITSPVDSNIIAAADYNNRIYISMDRGQNWAATSALPRYYTESVNDIQFDPQDDSLLYASTSYYGLFKSTDLGGTWSNINNNLPVDSYGAAIYGPSINPHNQQNMLVSSTHHGVYETRDGGEHWISFNAGLDTARCFGRIAFAPNDTSYIYMPTFSAGVWSIHRTLTDVEDDDPHLPRSLSLSAYPNPFNARTTIAFDLPIPARVGLAVYDLQGRRAAVLMDGEERPAGVHMVAWDAANLASGIYFVRLSTERHSRIIRAMLLK
jgi:photosystem II stability/assembly factor-like uncharacterized protein